MIRAVKPSLDAIREKVEAGERLDAAEAESLWDERIDLHELGELANHALPAGPAKRPRAPISSGAGVASSGEKDAAATSVSPVSRFTSSGWWLNW